MTETPSDPSPSCLGSVYLSDDGAIDGWCVYPDRPDERATVEFVVNGKVVRAMRATRLRLDRRDLGMGDGYCGFSFPFSPTSVADGERTILEVREKRLDLIIGRVILGQDDMAKTRRLDAAALALTSVDKRLAHFHDNSTLAATTDALGRTLLYLSGQAKDKRKLGVSGLQACLEQIATIPTMDLRWRPSPKFSLIIRANSDLADLAARIRSIAIALDGLGAEFILLDDGTSPLAALLPTRLRHLALVRIVPSDRPGAALNAAAAAARGKFLAYARHGGPGPADLRSALERAKSSKLGIDANVPHSPNTEVEELARHGLRCIVAREDFAALGGFDPVRREGEMWANFVAKAKALDLKIAPWAALQPGRLLAE